MKKVLVVLLVAITMSSCNEEESLDCSCGLVVSDRVDDYSIVVRNECSGNEKRWVLNPGDWFNAHVGEPYCITNATSW